MATTDDSTNSWSTWYLATDDGKALVEFTTCVDFSVSLDGEVVQESIEKGSFASYNKTISPISVSASMVKQGTAAELNEVLETVRGLQTGTKLFSFLTPEKEYRSLTLVSFAYQRKGEDGLNLLSLDLTMKEIKQVDISYTSVVLPAASVKDASAAGTQQTGTKSPEKVDLESPLYKATGTLIPASNNGTNQGGQ